MIVIGYHGRFSCRMKNPMASNAPTLKQLQYFVCIADCKTFRGAAQRLGVSQPTLSAQIYVLEKCLQLTLLERSRTGVLLTPAGRELRVNARLVLAEMQGLMDQADRIRHGPVGTFKIGVSPTVGPYLLPHILPELHQNYSDLKLYVREKLPQMLEQDLLEGGLDLMLSPQPLNHSQLTVEPLFSEPLHLVLPIDHGLAQLDTIAPEQLRGQSVLTLEQQYGSYHQVLEFCKQLGANILDDYEGTSLDALRQMVVMGMGMAFLPSLYIHSESHRPQGLKVATVEQLALKRQHVLAWRKNSANRGFYRQLALHIKTLVKQKLPTAILEFE